MHITRKSVEGFRGKGRYLSENTIEKFPESLRESTSGDSIKLIMSQFLHKSYASLKN
jgi:hypothetical protein